MYKFLSLTIANGLATVTLQSGSSANEFTAELVQELIYVANELVDRRDVKVVVLRSSLQDFSIGMTYEGTSYEQVEHEYKTIHLVSDAIRKWEQLPYPIIAAVQGKCYSLAFSLVLVADIRIVANNVRFVMPEITWGVVPAGGITQRLPRIIGKGPAANTLLGAKPIVAEEALALGLATAVVAEADLWVTAEKEALALSELSSLSLQYTKECLLRGSELPFNQGLRLELDVYMVLQTSKDRMEGVQAFLEKKQPNFVNE